MLPKKIVACLLAHLMLRATGHLLLSKILRAKISTKSVQYPPLQRFMIDGTNRG